MDLELGKQSVFHFYFEKLVVYCYFVANLSLVLQFHHKMTRCEFYFIYLFKTLLNLKICPLINFGKFSAIISLNFSIILLSPLGILAMCMLELLTL